MSTYTLNDTSKIWDITASTIAPKTSGTMTIRATSILAPINGTLDITATTGQINSILATTIQPLISGSLSIYANSIEPPTALDNLLVKATSIVPPNDRSLSVAPTGSGEIIFSKNYIVVNSTKIYFQSTDPGAVGAGSIWFDLP